MSRFGSRARLVLGAAAAAVAAAGLLGFAFVRALAPPDPGGSPVTLEVRSGDSLRVVARQLAQAGVIRDASAFVWLARLRGDQRELHAGEYRLSPGWWATGVLSQLAEGRVLLHEVSLPEGLAAAEIAQRLAAASLVKAKAFLKVVRDPAVAREFGLPGPTLEGYLFPDTYRLPRGLPPTQVAKVLVDQFFSEWKPLAPAAKAQGLSMREVVTLASIVEKETADPAERPLVASVYLNRLARGMRLDSDPTVIYGIPDFDGNLRRKDLENPNNPYNTYRIAGLPPTPISNPGRASLEAVVHPAHTPYLYFVSKNDGTHVFSRTYRQHEKAVDRYQRRGRPEAARRSSG